MHRLLGPGLLESVYEVCLVHELGLRGLHVERQRAVPIAYKGVRLECGYRFDLLVEHTVLVERKAVERLSALHVAQVVTYLRLLGAPVALLVNFNALTLRQGLRRITALPPGVATDPPPSS